MPDAITKSVRVAAQPARAFEMWVHGIDSWWPKTHSLSKDPQTQILFEAKPGGRFFERAPDGTEHDFGSIITYEPPNYLAYHWYLGSSATQPTRVQVRFTAEGGGTRVDVEHRGPDMIGDIWAARSGGFERAWKDVLPLYVLFCNQESTA